VQGIEGQELLLLVAAGPVAQDLGHLEDLVVHRPRAIGNHVVFVLALAEVDAIRALGKEVDGGRAEKLELRWAHGLFQAGVLGIEDDDDFQIGRGAAANGSLESGQVGEEEAAGEGEVFLQQPVALEGSRSERQERLVVFESQRPYGIVKDQLAPRRALAGRTHDQGHGVRQQQLVEAHGHLVAAAQVQRQFVERDLIEVQPAEACRRKRRAAFALPGMRRLPRSPRNDVYSAPAISSGHRVTSWAVRYSHAVCSPRPIRLLSADPRGTLKPSASAPSLRLGCSCTTAIDGVGEVVRVHHVQQVLREAGKLGVDLELDAGGEKGKRFQQALDVGIGAFERLDAEPAGDLGKLLRELLPGLADVLQLAVVVVEEARIHQPPPLLP
jgi:hypothetical protein